MPKKIKQEYKFKENIIEKMNKDGAVLVKISNILGTNTIGVQRMIDRNSQALMHIQICCILSEKYNEPIKELFIKIKR